MRYDREHEAALVHPIFAAGEKKVEASVAALRAKFRNRAKALRERAQRLLDEAGELDREAGRFEPRDGPFYDLEIKMRDDVYWRARKAVGEFPRDANGDYLDDTRPPRSP